MLAEANVVETTKGEPRLVQKCKPNVVDLNTISIDSEPEVVSKPPEGDGEAYTNCETVSTIFENIAAASVLRHS